MKKMYILFCLLALYAVSSVYALDLSFAYKSGSSWQPVPSGGTVIFSCKSTYVIDEYIRIQNNTSRTFCTWLVKSYAQKMSSPFKDIFCWDHCYNQNDLKSQACLQFIPGQIREEDFHLNYNPYKAQGETVIKYTFWNTNEVGDSAFIIVHYVSSLTGIEDDVKIPNLLASPNPCSGNTVFTLDGNPTGQEKIIISDLLGSRLLTLEIPTGETEVRADLSSLAAGLYIYFTESAGVIGRARKLVVKK